MMKSAFWRVTALAFAAVMILPHVVLATEAKHDALMGTPLIPTSADYNAFAHKAAGGDGFVELTTQDFDGSASASAKMIFGINDSFDLQLQANDSAFLTRVLDYAWGGTSRSNAVSLGSALFGAPSQVMDVDLIGGSDTSAWSIGVSLSQDKDEFTAADGTESGDSETGIGLRASFGNDQFDGAVEFGSRSASADDGSTVNDTNERAFGAFGKLYSDAWTFCGAVGIGTSDDGSDATSDDPSATVFMAGAGYTFRQDDDGTVTGEVMIDYMKSKDNGDGSGGSFDDTGIYVPACRVAVDHAIGSRFRVYAAATSSYVMYKTEFRDDADPPNETEVRERGYSFDWSAGLGFSIFDNVQLDAVLQTDNLEYLGSVGADLGPRRPVSTALGLHWEGARESPLSFFPVSRLSCRPSPIATSRRSTIPTPSVATKSASRSPSSRACVRKRGSLTSRPFAFATRRTNDVSSSSRSNCTCGATATRARFTRP